jgi:hypothetical protein
VARLRVTAATVTTATVTWPAALGEVRGYAPSVEGRAAKSTTSLSALLDGEAAALSAHFAVGTKLVRSLMRHFSAIDTNPCWVLIGSCACEGPKRTAGAARGCRVAC